MNWALQLFLFQMTFFGQSAAAAAADDPHGGTGDSMETAFADDPRARVKARGISSEEFEQRKAQCQRAEFRDYTAQVADGARISCGFDEDREYCGWYNTGPVFFSKARYDGYLDMERFDCTSPRGFAFQDYFLLAGGEAIFSEDRAAIQVDIPCQLGTAELRFDFWTNSYNVTVKVCQELTGQQPICDYMVSPENPLNVTIPGSGEPFRLYIESRGLSEEAIILIDNIRYDGQLCEVTDDEHPTGSPSTRPSPSHTDYEIGPNSSELGDEAPQLSGEGLPSISSNIHPIGTQKHFEAPNNGGAKPFSLSITPSKQPGSSTRASIDSDTTGPRTEAPLTDVADYVIGQHDVDLLNQESTTHNGADFDFQPQPRTKTFQEQDGNTATTAKSDSSVDFEVLEPGEAPIFTSSTVSEKDTKAYPICRALPCNFNGGAGCHYSMTGIGSTSRWQIGQKFIGNKLTGVHVDDFNEMANEREAGYAFVGSDYEGLQDEVFVMESPRFAHRENSYLVFDLFLRSFGPQLRVCIDSFDYCPYSNPAVNKTKYWFVDQRVFLPPGMKKVYFIAGKVKRHHFLAIDNIRLQKESGGDPCANDDPTRLYDSFLRKLLKI
ncbi:unnamed protein product, partial [Mesorhabditis spiculigera]